MPTLEVTVSVKLDGVPVAGFPVTRRREVDEAQQFAVERATGAGYVTLGADDLDEIQVLVLRTDQLVTVRLDGQTDAGLVLTAGGLLVLMDADIDAGVATNVLIDNDSGFVATLRGVAAGT